MDSISNDKKSEHNSKLQNHLNDLLNRINELEDEIFHITSMIKVTLWSLDDKYYCTFQHQQIEDDLKQYKMNIEDHVNRLNSRWREMLAVQASRQDIETELGGGLSEEREK